MIIGVQLGASTSETCGSVCRKTDVIQKQCENLLRACEIPLGFPKESPTKSLEGQLRERPGTPMDLPTLGEQQLRFTKDRWTLPLPLQSSRCSQVVNQRGANARMSSHCSRAAGSAKTYPDAPATRARKRARSSKAAAATWQLGNPPATQQFKIWQRGQYRNAATWQPSNPARQLLGNPASQLPRNQATPSHPVNHPEIWQPSKPATSGDRHGCMARSDAKFLP